MKATHHIQEWPRDEKLDKLIEEQTYEVIMEKYRGQLLCYSSKEIKAFDKSIEKLLLNKEYPKEVREAVWFFYMKLYVIEYSLKEYTSTCPIDDEDEYNALQTMREVR